MLKDCRRGNRGLISYLSELHLKKEKGLHHLSLFFCVLLKRSIVFLTAKYCVISYILLSHRLFKYAPLHNVVLPCILLVKSLALSQYSFFARHCDALNVVSGGIANSKILRNICSAQSRAMQWFVVKNKPRISNLHSFG